jgi:hypothetical protein
MKKFLNPLAVAGSRPIAEAQFLPASGSSRPKESFDLRHHEGQLSEVERPLATPKI